LLGTVTVTTRQTNTPARAAAAVHNLNDVQQPRRRHPERRSTTIVFGAPRHARGFFEGLCAGNLGIGRPEEMQVVFGLRVRTPPEGGYRTRLLRSGDEVTLNACFRHSPVKSYLAQDSRSCG
jgi:hypothetical protein